MNERKIALVLSGGGSRGAYQCGVWQALSELGIKIDIVVGVSVGAINGAMVVQGDVVKTTNLWREMATDMVFDVDADAQIQDFAKEFVVNRGAGSTGMQKMMREYIDEDVVRDSPIEYGLLTVEFPAMKPYYVWKEDIPRGKLYDYITASASAFPAVHTHQINGKDFIDGGYEDNLPVSMALEKGATEVIAVYLDAIGRFRPEELEEVPNLTFIKSKWDLGDFLVFDHTNTKRILRIGYLDAMKTFEIYDGGYYTFAKNEFDKRTLKQADVAAKIFDLDPLILYRKNGFLEALEQAVITANDDMDLDIDMSLSSLKSLASLGEMKEILKIANRRTVTLFIADSLRAKSSDSIFLSKYARRILKDEVNAAKFLVNNGLV